jgi:hypothetical protein
VAIVQAHVPEMTDFDGSSEWGQYFYWDGGSSGWLTNLNKQSGSWPSASSWQSFSPSRYFGWELVCNAPNGCNSSGAYFDVFDLQLEAYEYQTPTITPGPVSGGSNLWYQAGHWIRGTFPVDVRAQDPSGVCDVRVFWNGQDIQDTGERSPNSGYWDQCDPNHLPSSPQDFFTGATIDTTAVAPQSATDVQLAIQAHNASYNPSTGGPDWTSDVEYLNIDNEPVSLSVSGPPADVPLMPGVQYFVTATASAGPSGVGTIMCSVDGSSWTAEGLAGGGTQNATAHIPITGVGSHQVSCYATNQAFDSTGTAAASPTQTWSLKIGEPVNAGITFAKVIRHCRWVRVHNRKYVGRALRCHTDAPERRDAYVAHGRPATLSGWFATADGTALGHVPVSIMAAPDDGARIWRREAVVHTASDGSWRVTVPAGPSRLLAAVYSGGPQTEPSTSRAVTLSVPASSTLGFSRLVHFGQAARFAGRLLGGYVPRAGAIVVVQAFDRGHWRSVATVRSDGHGRWSARYAIGGGAGAYPIRVRIPHQADYPWAAAVTSPQTLTVRP